MKQGSLLKNQIAMNLFIIIIMFGGLLFSIKEYNEYTESVFFNKARILAADQLSEISKCFIKGKFEYRKDISLEYPFVVVDLKGEIIYSEKPSYVIGDRVTINEFIQIDQSLFENDKSIVKTTFAIVKEEGTVGFAAFFLPREKIIKASKERIIWNIFKGMIIGIILVSFILMFHSLYMKKRLLLPVKEMIESSKAIIKGNYDVKVIKAKENSVMSDDIDKLSYNFELMRDELKAKMERERELTRSQKELISCISHDLKTPISTIKAYSEGLRDGMAAEPEKVQKYANIIVDKTEVLTKMISDLLEHSNAEINQLTITPREQYMNEFLENLVKEIKGVVEHHSMDFYYNNNISNMLVSFDEQRITQVITNLVDNSLKYGKKDNGKIGIDVYLKDHESFIAISVWDNGNGIPVHDIPYIFNKFYRGEKSRNMSVPGSGLGLSICKYIVEKHGGEILYENKGKDGGKGSKVSFSLPL